MILRRVIAHFRKQEWTAIAIDFVIVVVGVFVATQVSNWNAARATDRQSRAATAQLTEDLRAEAWGFQYLLEYNEDVLNNAEKALAALDGRAARDDAALLVAAYRATQYREPRRRRSTYDELIATGTIGLIRDRALRDLAIKVYTTPIFENVRREGVESRYRELFRMTVPTEIQRALARSCGDRNVIVGDYRSIVGQLDYPCTLDLPAAAMREAAAALEAGALTVPLLRLRIANLESRRVDMLAPVNSDIRDGLKSLAGEPR